jgi:hypothetical protein
LRITALLIGVSCYYILGKREGRREGYIKGNEAGYEEGIYKSLGIKDKEIAEIKQMATKMEIGGMLVRQMDDRETDKTAAGEAGSVGQRSS